MSNQLYIILRKEEIDFVPCQTSAYKYVFNITNEFVFAKHNREFLMQKTSQVFLVSDGTGITVESFTNSLLSQFPNIEFQFFYFPYTDSLAKVEAILEKIHECYQRHQVKPIIFSTIIDPNTLKPLFSAPAEVFDLFNPMIDRLEHILGAQAIDEAGRAHPRHRLGYLHDVLAEA